VSVRGTIVRISSVKPIVTQMCFQCNQCTQMQSLRYDDAKYKVPTKCPTVACRSKSFVPEREAYDTKTIDSQKIR
jgi:DNA helicase MCM8